MKIDLVGGMRGGNFKRKVSQAAKSAWSWNILMKTVWWSDGGVKILLLAGV
jgi:hypothetical protein